MPKEHLRKGRQGRRPTVIPIWGPDISTQVLSEAATTCVKAGT